MEVVLSSELCKTRILKLFDPVAQKPANLLTLLLLSGLTRDSGGVGLRRWLREAVGLSGARLVVGREGEKVEGTQTGNIFS